MNLRQEVEKRLLEFANSQDSQIPVAIEAVPFTKPQTGRYMELVFIEPIVMNPTVDVTRVRMMGIIQIACYCPDGKGMRAIDELTQQVAALFPVADKQAFETFTVEQTPKISSSFPDDKFRCAVVRVKYRQELQE